MKPSILLEIFSRIKGPRLAVIGDCMLDEYVWGNVERISPEGPFPVLRNERRESRLGGAGNVVTNLTALGARVSFFSVVGDDGAGERVRALLAEAGCSDGEILALDRHPTTLKVRHIGYVQHADRAMQQLLRVDTEDTSELPLERVRPLLGALRRDIEAFDAILVSDYRKGLLGEAVLRELTASVGDRVPILVDPARIDDYSRYAGAFVICPNRYEAGLAIGRPCDDLERCRATGEELARRHRIENVAVTMDRDGIFLCRADGSSRHFSTQARVVTDVTGAGDMVLGMLGFVIGGGGEVGQAVQLANVAAGIAIRRMGAVAIPRAEVLSELLYRGHTGAVKIKTRAQIERTVADLRASGKSVVFANGCFDLLHFGHHYLLNQASQFGDCLIVAINSDTSIRRLKGPGRPVFKENERMLMLAGLESVDYIVPFEEDTPEALLEALRPNVLVKGSEYRDGGVVGREIVESYGGRIELVDQIPGISTSSLLDRQTPD